MPGIAPIYTMENVAFAFQLRWAMTMFTDGDRSTLDSLTSVEVGLESDGIRVLFKRYAEPKILQMTLSTLPHVSPRWIAQRVKGRLWHALSSSSEFSLTKKYALRSYGTQERARIESYVAGQAAHHPMATDRATNLFKDVNFIDESANLQQPIRLDESLVWFNLHIVIVHADRWRNVNPLLVGNSLKMVRSVCQKYGWRLSRCGIVADHLHLGLGANVSDSPQDVVLKLMNNLAYVHGMKPVYQFSAYVATFGEYDQRALRRSE